MSVCKHKVAVLTTSGLVQWGRHLHTWSCSLAKTRCLTRRLGSAECAGLCCSTTFILTAPSVTCATCQQDPKVWTRLRQLLAAAWTALAWALVALAPVIGWVADWTSARLGSQLGI